MKLRDNNRESKHGLKGYGNCYLCNNNTHSTFKLLQASEKAPASIFSIGFLSNLLQKHKMLSKICNTDHCYVVTLILQRLGNTFKL